MKLLRILPALAAVATACAHAPAQAPEARATRAFEAARKAGAPSLYAFLKPFPKGADLHMHLSGAIYAETFIAEAIRANRCVIGASPIVEPGAPPIALSPGTVGFTNTVPGKDGKTACPEGAVPVADAVKNQRLYDALVTSFSMRSFVPTTGLNGHDQFFATFDRFSGLKGFTGEWLDDVATRAAAQNEQYLEIMQTPSFNKAIQLSQTIGWPVGAEKEVSKETLAKLRDAYLAGGLRDDVTADTKELSEAQSARTTIEHCSPAPDFVDFKEHTACSVKIHWLYQVLRGFSPQQVFAQTLLGFELASADPDVVGINFVRAEDRADALAAYHLEQQMLDYLHSVYPRVHITLHAGELAPGAVPPHDLSFHIREAVNLGHAERIGHGVDILHENNPQELLAQMAKQHTMVEINLTSNDVILGITGKDHPLAAYRAAHVPWALSTDDEGVSRIDLTHEYVRAALDQNLTYADLKQSARTSLEHAFMPGASLYLHPDDFTHRIAACATPISAAKLPPGPCQTFLDQNEKASAQYELERRLQTFESNTH